MPRKGQTEQVRNCGRSIALMTRKNFMACLYPGFGEFAHGYL